MQHPDEGTIHAWLDAELPADEAAAFEAHVAECRDCAAAVAEARGLIAASSRIVSALDVVPADVIPLPASGKRAWYTNTQLRAAAAVLMVAGASFLVLRQDGEVSPGAPSRAVALKSQPSSRPSSPQASRADAVQEKARLEKSDRREQVADQSAGTTAGDASRLGSALGGKISGEAAPSSPTRVANAPPVVTATSRMPLTNAAKQAPVEDAVISAAPARIDSSNSRTETAMSNLIITAIAPASPTRAASALRVVKSDTTETTVVTVYAVAPGVEVTLSETARAGFAAPNREVARMRKESSGSLPSPLAEVARRAKIESITWTNHSTGRTYILRGALSMEELTVIRGRLPSAVR